MTPSVDELIAEIEDLKVQLNEYVEREKTLKLYCRQAIKEADACGNDQARAAGIATGALMCIVISGLDVQPADGTLRLRKVAE